MNQDTLSKVVLAIAVTVPLVVATLVMPWLVGNVSLPMLPAAPAATAAESQPAPRYSPPVDPTPPPTLAPAVPPPTPTPAEAAQARPSASPAASKRTHRVERGDELRHIAAEYGVSMADILAINDIPNPDSLRVGQVLTIPDAGP